MNFNDQVNQQIRQQIDAIVKKNIDAIYGRFGDEINAQGGRVWHSRADGKDQIVVDGLSDDLTERINDFVAEFNR